MCVFYKRLAFDMFPSDLDIGHAFETQIVRVFDLGSMNPIRFCLKIYLDEKKKKERKKKRSEYSTGYQ